MPLENWKRLIAVDDLSPGRVRFITTGEHELAVFRLSDPDRFVVTQNSCPHAGGNLAAGELRGSVVTCPWHQWEFDLDSGQCTLSDSVRLHRYDTRVDDGWLSIRLPF